MYRRSFYLILLSFLVIFSACSAPKTETVTQVSEATEPPGTTDTAVPTATEAFTETSTATLPPHGHADPDGRADPIYRI